MSDRAFPHFVPFLVSLNEGTFRNCPRGGEGDLMVDADMWQIEHRRGRLHSMGSR
jgi:hypothetical protein